MLAALPGACAVDEAADTLGTAQQEFAPTSVQTEVNVSSPLGELDTRDPSVAWIRMPDDANSGDPSRGHMLVAFTRREQQSTGGPMLDQATYAMSTAWYGATPTWNTINANAWLTSFGTHVWPAPANLCLYYPHATECNGSGFTWNTNGAIRWHAPAAALWTGLDRVAAVVTTGGGTVAHEDVFIVTSGDGGTEWRRSHVISTQEGGFNQAGDPDSGGNIVPDSVHASLAYFGERTSPLAGQVSLPIYVVWQNVDAGQVREWWWTRIIVGAEGEIAQAMPPRRLPSTVPREPGVHVSIFGYRVDGQEHVGLAWSERDDASSPNPCTSAQTEEEVTWYAAKSPDLGESWGCFRGNEPSTTFAGCSGGKTEIAAAKTWPTCIVVSATSPILNNDRPEVAINAPADYSVDGLAEYDLMRYFYFAIAKPSGSSSDSRVCVYRTGGTFPLAGDDHDRIALLACTPDTDASGRDVVHSHAQAISVSQGATTEPRVEVAYRNRINNPRKLRYDIMSLGWDVLPANTTTSFAHLSTADVDFGVGAWGNHSGLACQERCDPYNPGCNNDPNYGTNTDVGFSAAWSDSRRALSTKRAETYTRGFEWE